MLNDLIIGSTVLEAPFLLCEIRDLGALAAKGNDLGANEASWDGDGHRNVASDATITSHLH